MEVLQKPPTTLSRSRLYLILVFVSLILLFFSVAQIAYVVVEPSDFLGLIAHFTPAYWAGLLLILLCSIFAFLDRELKSDLIFVLILVGLGLFLFGVATLAEENIRSPVTYNNLADVRNLLVTGHSDIGGRYALDYYRAWPAAHLLSASVIQVTGTSLDEYIKFMPWFWLVIFIFVTYAIGRRFGLPQHSCFLLSFLALSSYWMFQSDFIQQGFAALLFLFCFTLIVKPGSRNTVAEIVMAMLFFTTLVLTHGLTSLALLAGLVVLSIYRRVRRQPTPLVFLFPVLWVTWYMYQSYRAFEAGIKYWWSAPWQYILRMGVHVEGLYEPTHTTASALITQYSQIAYIFIYGILAIAAVIWLFTSRVKTENRSWLMVLLVWVAGLALTGFMFPNREMYVRLYILGLVPVLGIILTAFSVRKLLIPLMLLSLLIFLPARYGTEGSYGQVYSSELAGVRFFGSYAGPVEPWFIYKPPDSDVLAFYNPDIIIWPKKGSPSFTSQNLSKVLGGASYVINSPQGGAPDKVVSKWTELGDGEKADLVYNNGSFRIYKNQSGE